MPAGTSSDAKPIRTQVTPSADPELQSYILAEHNSVGKDQMPSVFG
jgi:filamentous hemagglutinin